LLRPAGRVCDLYVRVCGVCVTVTSASSEKGCQSSGGNTDSSILVILVRRSVRRECFLQVGVSCKYTSIWKVSTGARVSRKSCLSHESCQRRGYESFDRREVIVDGIGEGGDVDTRNQVDAILCACIRTQRNRALCPKTLCTQAT